MRYDGETCVGCGERLHAHADDVVVCPECGAPMHRACWQQNNACPQREQHNQGYHWQATQPPEPAASFDATRNEGVICARCGENNPVGQAACTRCGAEFAGWSEQLLQTMEQEEERRERYFCENFPTFNLGGRQVHLGDTVGGQNVEDWVLQLHGNERNTTRYLRRFDTPEHRLGWNWAAFFAGPMWYFFRKLTRQAWGLTALMLLAIFAILPYAQTLVANYQQNVQPLESAYLEAEEQATTAKGLGQAEVALIKAQAQWLRSAMPMVAALVAAALVVHVCAALLADDQLRRKLLHNIASLSSTPPQKRFVRHRALVQMGGVSAWGPLIYVAAIFYLPEWIMALVQALLP